MNLRVSVALTALLTALWPVRGAQSPVRRYTTDDGLASNQINRIVRDSRGFLWFCTREGISRFDGYRFTNFGREQGLPSPDNDLLETRSGDYWIATADGLARFSPADARPGFTLYRPSDPKAHGITALVEDGAGGIWCGTEGGLYHLENVQAKSWPKKTQYEFRFVDIGMPSTKWSDGVIEALVRDHNGALWIGGPSGLYRRTEDGRCERYRLGKGPTRNYVTSLLRVTSLLIDHGGRFWVGTWDNGLLRISTTSDDSEPLVEKVYTVKNGLPNNLVEGLLESSDGQLWIGTSDGLCKFLPSVSHDEFETFTVSNGLSHHEVSALGEDRAGNLWAASAGVDKISRGGLVTYSAQDGLASNSVASIFEDRAGDLCVTTAVDGRKYVNRFDGQRFHPALPNIPRSIDNWGWGGRQLTFQDHTGKWWVPTAEGLFRFPDSPPAQLASAHPDAVFNAKNGVEGSVFVIFEDSRGDIWVSSQPIGGNRLSRWERATGTVHSYGPADGVPSTGMVHAISEDRAGNVWIGCWHGLARYRNGRFQIFEAPKEIELFLVRSIYRDNVGRLWVACRYGVVRIDSPEADSPKFTAYTTAQGLMSNDVQSITEDQLGRIYIGSGRGVDCFFPRTPFHVKHYMKSDGLALGNSMAAFRDRHGALWFGTPSGLSRLQPEPEGSPTPPPVLISAVRVRGVPRSISPLGEAALSGMEFGPDQNQIEVEFVGLGFGTGERLRYQYRLDGGDSDWSQPTDERRISLARLSPGKYRFVVRAITDDGLVSEKPATVEFAILAPIWQRWWMRALSVLILGAILYALYRYRLARVLEVERLRTRIATDLHDDLGSTLSQIAILSEIAGRGTGKPDQLSSYSEIADLARESVDSMSDIVWAIDPDKDRLAELSHRMRRFASDLFNGGGTQLHFHGPGEDQNLEIEAEVRRHIFLIFKESLHNTVRHAACTEVEIDFRLEETWLVLEVRDNGTGFDLGQVNKGHGLASIEQRTALLGGTLQVKSAPGCGTTIRLRVPFHPHVHTRENRTYTKG